MEKLEIKKFSGSVVGTVRNLQEQKKSQREIPKLQETKQKPSYSMSKKPRINSAIQKQRSINSSGIQKQRPTNSQYQATVEIPKNFDKNQLLMKPEEDYDDEFFEKYEQIKQQQGDIPFSDLLNYNQNHDLFKDIDYIGILNYILDKGKQVKEFISTNQISKSQLQNNTVQDFHFFQGFKKIIQDMIVNGLMVAQANNWNEKQVKKLEKFILQKLQFNQESYKINETLDNSINDLKKLINRQTKFLKDDLNLNKKIF